MYAFAIWVTTKCNMKCSYCYEGSNKENLFLDIKTADRVIKFVIETANEGDTVIVDFHGGEPLLNFPAIKYIVEKLKNEYKDYNFVFGITTNGTINTPEILEFLACNFFYSLTVSIDGTETSHNTNRITVNGNGTYHSALTTAMIFLKEMKRHDIRIRMTVVPDNVTELSKGIIELIEKGFTTIIPVVDYFNRRWTQEKIEIIRKELCKVKNYLQKNQKFSKVVVAMVNEENHNLGKCTGGLNSFHIVPTGEIYPCAYSVGNNDEKIGDIFNGIIQKKISICKKIYSLVNEECRGCANYNKCASSRCKYLNRSITGDYTKTIPILCEIENIKHEIKHS